jgi:ERCC4-type nuclease
VIHLHIYPMHFGSPKGDWACNSRNCFFRTTRNRTRLFIHLNNENCEIWNPIPIREYVLAIWSEPHKDKGICIYRNSAQKMVKVRVKIDIRETDVWNALDAWYSGAPASLSDGWEVVKQTLDVGDVGFFIVQDDNEYEKVLLERKTVEDLGASQRDGRYREQRARLLARQGAGTRVGYLLEAPNWSANLSRTWCRGAFSEVHLQTAIVRLQMRYGMAVFHTQGVKETVQWIRRIATALVNDSSVFESGVATDTKAVAAAYTEAIHVKKSANLEPERILNTLLRTLPGVGIQAADAIVQYCRGNFSRFYELSESEIANIRMGADGKRKVGQALSKKVWPFFHTHMINDNSQMENIS